MTPVFGGIMENSCSQRAYMLATFLYMFIHVHHSEWWDGFKSLHVSVTSFRTDDTLNFSLYSSVVLKPVTLPFIQALRSAVFQQDIVRLHDAGTVWTLYDTENVRQTL